MATTITPVAASMNRVPGSTIGTQVPRIDGPLKTTGTAKYTSDYNLPNMVYAVPVCATIARGAITRMDTAEAGQMRGVVKIYHHAMRPSSTGLTQLTVTPTSTRRDLRLKTRRFTTAGSM